ncbi:MAG TPA: phosphopantetheine-binding protein, partial [Polyangiaceae bacterium]
ALAHLPGVDQAVVVLREVRPGDVRLVGYVVAKPGSETEEAALRRSLKSTLPEYMIPQHVVALERFPLTPNGKVDRRALPSPMGAERGGEGYVAPSTSTEKMLAALWQELLGVARVGAHDNFFDLGGHSLLCLQMTSRLAQTTGVRLNPRIILRNDLSQVAAQLPESASPPPPSQKPASPEKKSLAQRLLGRLMRS